MDSTISLLPKSKISSFWPFSETAQTGLCRTWSETPKTGFLPSRLIFNDAIFSRYLDNNLLELIPDGSLTGMNNLKRLDMSDNQLTEITDGMFDDLTALTYL